MSRFDLGETVLRLGLSKGNTMKLQVSAREFHTILAALRNWQATRHLKLPNLDEIATNEHTVESLTNSEIDALCERLNTESEEPNTTKGA